MDKFAWMKALRGAEDLTNAEYRVLVNLSTFTDASLGNAYPGNEQLFKAACVSPSAGKRAMRALLEKGWVVLVEEGGNKHWRGKANVYAVTVPKGATHDPLTEDETGRSDVEGGHAEPQGGQNDHEGGHPRPPISSFTPSPLTNEKNSAIADSREARVPDPYKIPDDLDLDDEPAFAQWLDDIGLDDLDDFEIRLLEGIRQTGQYTDRGAIRVAINRILKDRREYIEENRPPADISALFGTTSTPDEIPPPDREDEPEAQDDLDWLSQAVFGLDADEEQAATQLLAEGVSRYAIVKGIQESRRRRAS